MRVRQVRHEFRRYDDDLRRRIGVGADPTALDGEVGRLFGDVAADVLKASRIGRARVAGVGSHGQPCGTTGTLRIGSPAAIAQRVGAAVVSDFAAADIAAGGRGEPLTGWSDYVLFAHRRKARVLLDLGRIATLTFLPAAAPVADMLIFDTGPGTAWTDTIARRHFDRLCDIDGAIAASGTASESMLAELLGDPCFLRRAPKTCDRCQWGPPAAERLEAVARTHRVEPVDLMATACELTARAAVGAIAALTQNPHEVILCGGGVRNINLTMRLRKLLVPASTVAIERFDIDATAMEALRYAVLAAARLDDVPTGIPSLTGAVGPAKLGKITAA